jgi:hypothetical protein
MRDTTPALDRSSRSRRPRLHDWQISGGVVGGVSTVVLRGAAPGKGMEDGVHCNGFTTSGRRFKPEGHRLTVTEGLQRLRECPAVGGGGEGDQLLL